MSDTYDVVHVKGCWGCEEIPEWDYEPYHCKCCEEQWLHKEES